VSTAQGPVGPCQANQHIHVKGAETVNSDVCKRVNTEKLKELSSKMNLVKETIQKYIVIKYFLWY
jgi:uncharacterized FlaG/YvyC family protein